MVNLFEQGLLGWGSTLAARLLAGGGNFLLNHPFLISPLRSIVRCPISTDTWLMELIPVPNPHGPFPYGMAVEPP